MIRSKYYCHSNKEDAREWGVELGLSGNALDHFRYTGYEVEFDIEVDEVTGQAYATHVNGVSLIEKVKI